MTAARTGIPAALRVLLDRGARVDARDPEFQQTALMIAAREGHAAAVQLLLERKADPNAQTRKGPVPPFVPPCKGTGCGSEGVGINRGGLPDRGRRLEAKGGMTPLLYAARDGHAGGGAPAGGGRRRRGAARRQRHPAAADRGAEQPARRRAPAGGSRRAA